ncbi:hypothetical protein ABF176_002393 [Flavobacterium psychrophilum]
MEEHRAKATMVFHRPRSGGSMEKIVPKGDFFHRLALRLLGIKEQQTFRYTKQYKNKTNIQLNTIAPIAQNLRGCCTTCSFEFDYKIIIISCF